MQISQKDVCIPHYTRSGSSSTDSHGDTFLSVVLDDIPSPPGSSPWRISATGLECHISATDVSEVLAACKMDMEEEKAETRHPSPCE
ncbi:hypothetical protein KM043_003589 [Ampulex compressa]|nr:hypothetical protein KM043_003589 [Ampulex compressa]